MKFIFFTKTLWPEPPRIRHQLASMLVKRGHKVIFFEAPSSFYEGHKIDYKVDIKPVGLNLFRSRELFHHQLRVSPVLSWLNAAFEKGQIKKLLHSANLNGNEIIVNFNYDYVFLRDLFRDNKIVTIINDDFVAQARFFKGRHVLNALKKTCKDSDSVLTVSYPLVKQLVTFCDPELFFPWADNAYVNPKDNNRSSVLLWASISNVIDFELLRNIVKNKYDTQFDVVGPLHSSVTLQLKKLCKTFDNVAYFDALPLSELHIDNYYAAILPYKAGVKAIEAVTLANKSLRLMSKGLPLVCHGMPYYYEHEAIHKCDALDSFIQALDFCKKEFVQLQPGIELFVKNNTEEIRYQQFLKIINT